jgi:regulatory protein
VESVSKKKGGRLIRLELKRKGLEEADVDTAMETLDEETEIETAKKILDKYMRGKNSDRETLYKAFRYLMGKGFEYEIAKSALSTFGEMDEE